MITLSPSVRDVIGSMVAISRSYATSRAAAAAISPTILVAWLALAAAERDSAAVSASSCRSATICCCASMSRCLVSTICSLSIAATLSSATRRLPLSDDRRWAMASRCVGSDVAVSLMCSVRTGVRRMRLNQIRSRVTRLRRFMRELLTLGRARGCP